MQWGLISKAESKETSLSLEGRVTKKKVLA